MKKLIALLLALVMVIGLVACGETTPEIPEEPDTSDIAITDGTEEATQEATQEATEDDIMDIEVMTYAEYDAAPIDTAVCVEAYVQAHQSWWNDQITVYAADHDGAYFLYNMACSQEDAEKLVPGTKIRVTGFKGEWSGEVEIMDATFEFVEGADTYIAEAEDLTAVLGTEELISHQNKFAAFNGLTVEASNDAGDAFLYNWDGSGAEGTDSDLYFKASLNGQTYTFVIEYYLCNESTEAYQAVKNLKVGDVINMEGFVYWYDGVQPHITSVEIAE